MNQEYSCVIKVRLSQEHGRIIKGATNLGRANGRDDDWVPKDLNDAISEIIMIADAPAYYGVEILE